MTWAWRHRPGPETGILSSSKKELCWILSGDSAKGKLEIAPAHGVARGSQNKETADTKKMKPPGGKVARFEGIG
ncbi:MULTISPECIES: hypothetical protein [unclassified Afipia]|uniref:hypothetical protein n=1 Tax=unclassified Afipia TaxID=2642050 RepID=UPI0012681CAF|nr:MULTISPECIES: hypothetical protein [unclassified Afipia]